MVQNNLQTGSVIANIDNIKQINYAAIYKVIEKNTPISRVKIANISKLAPASVTKITRQLLENGLIKETERQASTGGRSAISLAPNGALIHVLAITIGRDLLSISRYNLSGHALATKQVNIESTDGEALIEQITDEITLQLNDDTEFSEKISAISFTLSGLVNTKEGTIIYSSRYSFDHFPLVKNIEQKFNIPTFIGNHTRALALAEHYFGASQDCLDSILLSVHHGVGSGIIIQGKCLIGENCNIGEIGHIQVNPAGKQCHCGNFGCLETEINDDVILEKVKMALERGSLSSITTETLNIENIYQAAADHDPLCEKIIQDAATYLGKTIAVLINILNPEKIIVAGKIAKSGNTLFAIIQQCVTHQTLPKFQKKITIAPAELQQQSTIAPFALIKEAMYEGDLLQKLRL
tara:strand:+ start:12555 stop:13781 length:1227 start_codon:yes stop_codon:yes gene_type:complete